MILAIDAGFISASGCFSISTFPEPKSVTNANSADESISAALLIAEPTVMKESRAAPIATQKRITDLSSHPVEVLSLDSCQNWHKNDELVDDDPGTRETETKHPVKQIVSHFDTRRRS